MTCPLCAIERRRGIGESPPGGIRVHRCALVSGRLEVVLDADDWQRLGVVGLVGGEVRICGLYAATVAEVARIDGRVEAVLTFAPGVDAGTVRVGAQPTLEPA